MTATCGRNPSYIRRRYDILAPLGPSFSFLIPHLPTAINPRETESSNTEVSTTTASNSIMGASSSKPKKAKGKGKANRPPKVRNSVALRQRMSLNKETLDRVLKQIGHPVQEPTRDSTALPGLEQALRTLSTHAFAMALPGGETNNRECSVVGFSRQVDKDKQLPPWPSVVTIKRLDGEQQMATTEKLDEKQQMAAIQEVDEEQVPVWPPPVTTKRLEEQLERSYIQRRREETLRLLELGPDPHQPPACRPSRVPSIIRRRIRRAAVAWDGSGLRDIRG